MALKRSADELESAPARSRRVDIKRTKLSPSADTRSTSSVPSSCSVSEASALQSSPQASAHERISSMSSLQATDTDDTDSESSMSSDSESDLSESDEEDESVVLGGPKKPQIHRVSEQDGGSDLKARITALLPQLEEANSLLTSDMGQYSMEDVEDGEQHIEMNLGLGVLEEQQDGDEDGASGSEGSQDNDGSEGEDGKLDLPVSSSTTKRSHKQKETGVMDKLAGRQRIARGAAIQELG